MSIFNDLFGNQINPTGVRTSGTKRFGTILIELGFASQTQIDMALAEQMSETYKDMRIGHILEQMGVITRTELDRAIEVQLLDSTNALS